MEKRVILFVDDEARILEGLRVRLHRQRARWEMLFALSGQEALAVLAQRRIDVIVSDMRMPGMDGATLLHAVQEQYPRVVRIVLSGHSEEESALRALPVTHQFLSKPCEPGLLESVVDRACQLQELIGQESVRTMLGRVDRLPSPPHIYLEMRNALLDEQCTTQRVADILRRDMGMCAKVLQLVNSAFFALARAITEPEDAVSYLGFDTLRQVVLAAEVFHHASGVMKSSSCLEQMQTHAVQVARIAASFFESKRARDEAFICGLLHDIGRLVLCLEMPESLEAARRLAREQAIPHFEAEERLCSVSHAEIGGYLLGLWGLPYAVVETVANHHHPQRVPYTGFGSLCATYVADYLVHDVAAEMRGVQRLPGYSLDLEYLESAGIAGQVDGWRELVRQDLSAHHPLQ